MSRMPYGELAARVAGAILLLLTTSFVAALTLAYLFGSSAPFSFYVFPMMIGCVGGTEAIVIFVLFLSSD